MFEGATFCGERGTGRRGRLGDAKYNKELPTWRPNAQAPTATPLIPPIKMMNGVGGTSIHYLEAKLSQMARDG